MACNPDENNYTALLPYRYNPYLCNVLLHVYSIALIRPENKNLSRFDIQTIK